MPDLPDLDVQECEAALNRPAATPQLLRDIGTTLLLEVIRLRHTLADPRYEYAGGRISRAALTCRDLEIEILQGKLRALTHGAAAEKT